MSTSAVSREPAEVMFSEFFFFVFTAFIWKKIENKAVLVSN